MVQNAPLAIRPTSKQAFVIVRRCVDFSADLGHVLLRANRQAGGSMAMPAPTATPAPTAAPLANCVPLTGKYFAHWQVATAASAAAFAKKLKRHPKMPQRR